jgi:mannitol 2-dehydrogenase
MQPVELNHLGLGGFHRPHMTRYTHSLMDCRTDAFGIVGAGLMPADRRRESLNSQDNLYILVERDASNEIVTVTASLAGVIFTGYSSVARLQAIDNPNILPQLTRHPLAA